jgi:hypothetical protein
MAPPGSKDYRASARDQSDLPQWTVFDVVMNVIANGIVLAIFHFADGKLKRRRSGKEM